jgi:hypothetical protein
MLPARGRKGSYILDKFAWGLGAGIAVLAGGAVTLAIIDSENWEAFKIEHACKLVSKGSSTTFNTFGIDGKGQPVVGIGVSPGQNGWLCDDGVTYYR